MPRRKVTSSDSLEYKGSPSGDEESAQAGLAPYIDDATDPQGAMAEVMDGTPIVPFDALTRTPQKLAKAKPRGAGEDDPVNEYNPFAPPRGVVPPGMPKVSNDMERIVERIFSVDISKEYERLERELKIGEKRNDRGTVAKAADDAEDNARIAFDMYCQAYAEQKKWEAEISVVEGPMRSEANQELQREKNDGHRSKAITDGDVEAKMAALHPDEILYIAQNRVKLKLLVLRMERFADLWQSRCPKTRSFLDKVR